MPSLPITTDRARHGRASATTLVALAIALSCVAPKASAQDALLDQAAALLSQRDAPGAYALLSQVETQRGGEARFDYLLGVAALDSGHITRAIFALERLVDQRPEDTLARAELGRAYLAAGEPNNAREALRQARSGALPEGASGAIDRVIGVIDQVSPPSAPQVSAYLEVGVGYDSNVNSATNQGEFAIPGFGGILFQTAPENRQQHDLVAMTAGGVAGELALSPVWQVVAAANLRAAVDRVVHDMNTAFLDATIGVRHTSGRQSQTIALQNSSAWVGSKLYRGANGLSAQWQSQISARSQASLFGQWSRQDYKGQTERNTDRTLVGLGFAHDFGPVGPLTYGSAYTARERPANAEFPNFGHRATGLRLGLELPLSARVTGFAEWQHERRHYGGSEPFFDMGRRDSHNDATAGLRFRATEQWQMSAQAHATRARSNVVLYDYSRSVFQITVRRSFQ